jgi:hypothetical protein
MYKKLKDSEIITCRRRREDQLDKMKASDSMELQAYSTNNPLSPQQGTFAGCELGRYLPDMEWYKNRVLTRTLRSKRQ